MLEELAREQALLAELDRQRELAAARVLALREQIAAAAQEPPVSQPTATPTGSASLPMTSEDKLKLFRSLFRGRMDVFPRLWTNSQKGTKGYAPACANEWKRGVCAKPKVKCGECPHQAFIPVDDQIVLDHLHGRHVIGAYPMLQDESCWFLAADFDESSWKEDVTAFVATCHSAGLLVAVERSRSGEGAHVWFFFASPIPVTLARKHPGEPLNLVFHGELTPIQREAARALLPREIGVFVAPPGIGKTVLGTYLVAQRACTTLILVHRTALLDQWMAQLPVFLGVDPKEIGQIGGGKRKPSGRLDVAMIQSLIRDGKVDDLVARYGHVIVDECHHLPAVSFERVLSEVKARYLVGLTATPQRRDGHHPITEMQLGPILYTVDPKSQAARRPFDHRLVVRETALRLGESVADSGIQAVYSALAADGERNRQILNDVIAALEAGRSPILLTQRKDHLEYFAAALRKVARHVVVLQGGMSAKTRREVAAQLVAIPDTEERIVLATGPYIGEGFDDARLDTLFLALPIAWKGTLIQYTGRLHRLHPRKAEVQIFDYVDREVPVLLRMFEKRLRTYRAIGYARGEAPLGFKEKDEPVIRVRRGGASPLRGGHVTRRGVRPGPKKQCAPGIPTNLTGSRLDQLIEDATVECPR